MTDKQEDIFRMALVDMMLLFQEYGASYVIQELQLTYPNTYKELENVFLKKQEKKIPVLFRKNK